MNGKRGRATVWATPIVREWDGAYKRKLTGIRKLPQTIGRTGIVYWIRFLLLHTNHIHKCGNICTYSMHGVSSPSFIHLSFRKRPFYLYHRSRTATSYIYDDWSCWCCFLVVIFHRTAHRNEREPCRCCNQIWYGMCWQNGQNKCRARVWQFCSPCCQLTAPQSDWLLWQCDKSKCVYWHKSSAIAD